MAFSPVDFYHLAGWLYVQQSPHDEARARTVISKAYYAAFLEARNKAGITDMSPGVHEKVRSYYSKAGKLALANRLDESRVTRNKADYDTTWIATSRDSGKILSKAREILKELGVSLV